MQNEGAFWLVFSIAFPHQAEVEKCLTPGEGRGRAFWHAPDRGELRGRGVPSIRRAAEGTSASLEKAWSERGEQRGEWLPCALGSTGSGLRSCPPSFKVNGGKEDGGDANRAKSRGIGAPPATRVVGNGYSPSAFFGHRTCAVVCRIPGMQLSDFPLAIITQQWVGFLYILI